MAKANPDTILLKGNGLFKEALAGTAITPGYLIQRSADGDVDPHASAASTANKLFAVENELLGKEITVDYAVGDKCYFVAPERGAEIYALVAAAAPAIVIGDYLESAGDGTLRKVAVDTATDQGQRAAVVAQALEAVDNSGGGTEARIKVEIL